MEELRPSKAMLLADLLDWNMNGLYMEACMVWIEHGGSSTRFDYKSSFGISVSKYSYPFIFSSSGNMSL